MLAERVLGRRNVTTGNKNDGGGALLTHELIMSTVSHNLRQCTWRYALVNGKRTDIVDAERGIHGICPLCGAELAPRKGTTRNWHWYHLSGRQCDDWYEAKGRWHRAWQAQFDEEWQEVPVIKTLEDGIKKHIADVKTPNGWTIEFQYSHISVKSVKAREDFYGNMVWVVSGTRLKGDRLCGYDLMRHHKSFMSIDGVKYFAIHANALPDSPFGVAREKFIFFDFDGNLDEPQMDGNLLCVLPRDIKGERIVSIVPKPSLIECFRHGEERAFLTRLWGCWKEYSKLVQDAEEERKRKTMEDAQRRERYLQQPKKAQYAITFGWLQAYLLASGKIKHVTMDNVLNCSSLKGDEGLIAIHCMSNYTEEQYCQDIEYVKANKYLRDKWKISDETLFPDYDKLKVVQGAVVGRARYRRFEVSDYCSRIVVDRFERLRKPNETKRIVLDVPYTGDIWALSGEIVIEVNNLAKSVSDGSQDKNQDVGTDASEKKSFTYTGQGDLYRESKSGWLYILKDGKMIPLKAEHQHWARDKDSCQTHGLHGATGSPVDTAG